MSKFLLICILFGVLIHPKAQLYRTLTQRDLMSELKKKLPDSTRLELLLQLARKHYFERIDKSNSHDSLRILLEQAQDLSIKMNYFQWQPEICCYLTKYYYGIGNLKMAIVYDNKVTEFINGLTSVNEQIARWKKLGWNIAVLDSIGLTRINCFEKMQSLYRQMNNVEKDIEMQREIADTHMKQGKLELAEKELSDVLRRCKAIGYPNLHYTYNLLAVTNRLKGNYDKALQYALLSIESMQKTRDSGAIRIFYGHIAFLYHEMGQTEKSIQYHKVFFQIDNKNDVDFYDAREAGFFVSDLIKGGQKDEARIFLLQFSKMYPSKELYSKAIIAKMYAEYYLSIGDETNTNNYIQEMIRVEPLLGRNNEIKRDICYDIGQYYFNIQQYEKAANYFGKALDEAILNNSVTSKKDIHLMLYKTDSSLGNYVSAMRHMNHFRQLNDSIFTQAKIREVEEVQVKYETEKKEQSIKLLEQESKLQQIKLSEASITRNWMLAGGGLLLVMIVFLIHNGRLKQRINKKLALQQTKIEHQNNSLRHLVTEKEWLLKEVHHRVKNNLQTIVSLLELQAEYLSDDALAAIQVSQNRIFTTSLLHQKLYQFENVSSVNMKYYIPELIQYLQEVFDVSHEIEMKIKVGEVELDVSQAMPLGLIINEAISNAIKYAFREKIRPPTIILTCSKNDQGFAELLIADNGEGFHVTKEYNYDGLGLKLIKGLAKDIDGQATIESGTDGTFINIRFKLRLPLSDIQDQHRRSNVSS